MVAIDLSACDAPRSLRAPDVQQWRRDRLDDPHMVALRDYVAGLRAQLRSALGPHVQVPDFDPCDGGVQARCLFLLESPGRRACQSGFVSRNNPDATAAKWLELNTLVGLPRSLTALWNAVPWYVGTAARLQRIGAGHLAQARDRLPDLLEQFPQLRAVVFVGRNAQAYREEVARLAGHLDLFDCPHPSPCNINTRPQAQWQIESVLAQVKRTVRA